MKFHISTLPNKTAVIESEPFNAVVDRENIWIGYTTDATTIPSLKLSWDEARLLWDMLLDRNIDSYDREFEHVTIVDMMSSDNDIHLKVKGANRAAMVMEYQGRHWNCLVSLLGTLTNVRVILLGNRLDKPTTAAGEPPLQPIMISVRAAICLNLIMNNSHLGADEIISKAYFHDKDAWKELIDKSVIIVHSSHEHKSVLFTKSMISVLPETIGKK